MRMCKWWELLEGGIMPSMYTMELLVDWIMMWSLRIMVPRENAGLLRKVWTRRAKKLWNFPGNRDSRELGKVSG